MKVCKFEKIKDEDEMKQVINCIQKEHPYVAVVPILEIGRASCRERV